MGFSKNGKAESLGVVKIAAQTKTAEELELEKAQKSTPAVAK